MGSETCVKRQRQMIFFDFRGKKSCLGDEFEGPPDSYTRQMDFLDSHARRKHFDYLGGPKQTLNNKVMADLVNTGPDAENPMVIPMDLPPSHQVPKRSHDTSTI